MATIEMVMPQMGESIIEGTILTWLKREGDTIEQDESVLEVATDKVDTEVPATHAGVLKTILAKEGEVIGVGMPIAIIETEDENGDVTENATKASPKQENVTSVGQQKMTPPNNTVTVAPSPMVLEVDDTRFYSPLVRNIAKEEGITAMEMATIPGSGKDARVTKQDMLNYLATRSERSAGSGKSNFQPASEVQGGDEIIEMDRMRAMIAQRMLDSQRISAHVTSFVEADVTNMVLWRNKNKEAYKQKEGEPITYTPFFVQAIAKAIKDFPMINVSVEGNKIIYKKEINIGVAVALPSGNLIVPVIRRADQLNLVGLSKKINDLAARARNNSLTPDEVKGGTYTLSNVGTFGNVMGTPIIVQPQVAILAVGTITKKPAVIETPTGDVIAIRHKMFLSHSYDHRVVDGSLGGQFVKRVADYLEAFDLNFDF
ncbi:MAG TPA: dihydrolipoamide acetyltransferase family protein [Cyclobacteriaceae bacterium]|nr:dihydrolipoamide acetyltransferase family protein [Cyclobacteriaceae bacterium]